VGLLVYSAITSLDGYLSDAEGRFDWAEPDEEVHRFVNDMERPVGVYLYGARMYAVMVAWEDPSIGVGESPYIAEYGAIWRSAEKVVYSTTLDVPRSERTRIERRWEPEAVRSLKAAGGEISVGGAGLAALALRDGLVDEVRQFLAPVVVGGGTRAVPDGVRLDLELLEERRFSNGTVYLRYAVRR
jgi:dihydrofolate reductase